ncbi:cbb3-type cytochrome oxidase subunit 3 [Halomonas korlensis]|uniref:Cytochrome c oxidase cbb3-type subunit 4 n=1 Tax=Halomonas korlensis TaxID=463301 RepID=A0A1I7JFP3_9GAMM|nr:cbb3-type cytochrome c oxidase subunit 3 [Halomonas korlensis]SFU84005.1 cytochrome c oxidase cbb3-type subunit 4 [Halomonas korlensis]
MDTGTFRGIITGLLIIAFLGLTFWAYSKRRKPDFDEAANLPFADEEDSSKHASRDAHRHETDPRDDDARENQGDKNT